MTLLYTFHDNLDVIREKCRYREKNDDECDVRGNRRCKPIWPCYENENMGRAMGSEIGPAVRPSSRCAGGIVIIVREGGRFCASRALKWRASRVLFGLGKKKRKKKREEVFRRASTFEERRRRKGEERDGEGGGIA